MLVSVILVVMVMVMVMVKMMVRMKMSGMLGSDERTELGLGGSGYEAI